MEMALKKNKPVRTCCACGKKAEKNLLLRVIVTKDREVLICEKGKGDGRGAYVCPKEECIRKAQMKKGLERVLKSPVPAHIYEELTGLVKRV